MDVVTAYLYGSLDSDIYMNVPDGISVPNLNANRNMYCVKLIKSLYGLKQSERMWYNRLKEFLLNKGYSNSDDCSYVFIRKSSSCFYIISVYVDDLNIIGHANDINEAHNHLKKEFYIISVYIDDLNIIGHAKDINEAHNHLKKEFEMKDLGTTKFCLGLQIEHLQTCILVHQSAYVNKVLEKFNMDKAYTKELS
jgi:hypothetical protein